MRERCAGKKPKMRAGVAGNPLDWMYENLNFFPARPSNTRCKAPYSARAGQERPSGGKGGERGATVYRRSRET